MTTSTSHPELVHRGLHVQIYSRGPMSPVRWRLVGGNNRDMGRGAREYPDEQSCLVGIKEITANLSSMVCSLVSMPGNRWGWRLSLDGTVMVTSGHSFDRRRRCEDGCARFLQFIPEAEVRPGVSYLFSGGLPSEHGRGSTLRYRQGISVRFPGVHLPATDESLGSDVLGTTDSATSVEREPST
jgi:hypothetical protein